MKFSLILIVFLLMLSSRAECSQWVKVSENVVDDTFFVDMKSIKQLKNNIVRAWSKVFFKKNPVSCSELGHTCHSMVRYLEFDCDAVKTRTLQQTLYDKGGEIIISMTDESAWHWEYATPDTVIYAVHEFICDQKQRE